MELSLSLELHAPSSAGLVPDGSCRRGSVFVPRSARPAVLAQRTCRGGSFASSWPLTLGLFSRSWLRRSIKNIKKHTRHIYNSHDVLNRCLIRLAYSTTWSTVFTHLRYLLWVTPSPQSWCCRCVSSSDPLLSPLLVFTLCHWSLEMSQL